MDYKMENYLPELKPYNEAIKQYLYDEACALPKLPLPALKDTLSGYLEMARHFVPNDKLEYTKYLVSLFQTGEGVEAQKYLTSRQNQSLNWSLEYFIDEYYLDLRFGLAINLNPAVVMEPRKFKKLQDVAEFGTAVIMACLQLKSQIDNKTVEFDKEKPMCMSQWYASLTTCRVPGQHKDTILTTLPTSTSNPPLPPQQEHCIVMHNHQMYSVVVKRGNMCLTPAEITFELLTILESSRSSNSSCELPVGVLTSCDRDNWANAYQILIEDATNKVNLDVIMSSLLIVCFDEDLPHTFNAQPEAEDENPSSTNSAKGFHKGKRDETNMFLQMLHGGGSLYNGANRWYDKTLQVIISKDGVNGACMEHTAVDGICFTDLMDRIIEMATNMERQPKNTPTKAPLGTTSKLTWNVNQQIQQFIADAFTHLDNQIDDFDCKIVRFTDFGKSEIKKLNCSPDVLFQLSLQLAIYKLHGRLESSWESISTRRFVLGRVDIGHSHSMQTLEWVKAMNDSTIDDGRRLKLLEEAIDYHRSKMIECGEGKGVDLHLVALQRAATQLSPTATVPPIFNDLTYALVTKYTLGTSQVASDKEMFVGYGYAFKDSYACCYHIRNDHIIFCTSTWKSVKSTSTQAFANSLKKALNQTKKLLQTRII